MVAKQMWDEAGEVGAADRDDKCVGVDVSFNLGRLEEECSILPNSLLRLGGWCINGGDGSETREHNNSQEDRTTASSVHCNS